MTALMVRLAGAVGSHARTLCIPLLLLTASALALGAEKEADTPFCRIFDTGVCSDETLPAEAVAKRAGWKLIPEDNIAHQFAGDAALANDKLAVVMRRKSGGADLYAATANGPKHRAALGHVGARSSTFDPPEALKVTENTPGAAMLELAFRPGQATTRFRITTGEGILEIRPGDGAHSVDVLTKSFCVLVPDFFADDMVFVPEKFNGTLLPAENFFLGLTEGGDAMMMAVWQSGGQDVTLGIASAGKETKLCSTRITCARDKSLWLAFLEHPRLWTGRPDFPWKPAFPAKWRYTLGWGRGGHGESGDGPSPEIVPGIPPGLWIVYPIDRAKATPLTIYTPMDVLRNTLGVGPCQYILQSQGLASQTNPTADNVMGWVEKQFKRGKAEEAADEVKERLKEMVAHMGKMRSRIEQYASFGSTVFAAVRAEKWEGGPPGPTEHENILHSLSFLEEFAKNSLEYAGPAERPAQLADQVAALIEKENALSECERLGAELRGIEATLNRTLSKWRMRVLWLRQLCRMNAAASPEAAGMAKMIQGRAERVLQSK